MNKIDPVFIKAITDNVTEVKETKGKVSDRKYAGVNGIVFHKMVVRDNETKEVFNSVVADVK
jgi:hypothetical protein